MHSFCRWLGVLGLWAVTALAGAAPFEIRTISQKAYPAKYDLADPVRPGLCLELLRQLERLDPALRFVGLEQLATTAHIVDNLAHGDIQMFVAMMKTPDRARLVRFLDPPVFQVPQVLVVRKSDPIQPRSWLDVRGATPESAMLVVANSGQASTLKSLGGFRVDDQAFTVEANIKKLLAGRGRFVYVAENNAQAAIAALGVQEQVRILRPAFIPPENLHIAFSPSTPSVVVERIGRLIRQLEHTGELERIRRRYLAVQ